MPEVSKNKYTETKGENNMKKSNWILVAAGLIAGVASVTGFGISSSAEEPPKVSAQVGTTHDKSLDAKEVKVPSKVKLDTPGPIEHYVWNHRGDTDEVWHNTETGQWRIVKKLADGTSSVGIYANGSYYKTWYDQAGKVTDAEQIPQAATYSGKDSAFKAMSMENSIDLTDAGSATYDGSDVQVLVEKHEDKAVKESHKYYVDKQHNLPLKKETTVNGESSVETWGYSYEQTDQNLFSLPSNVTFKLESSVNTPQDGKNK
jgi:hypothetical protein